MIQILATEIWIYLPPNFDIKPDLNVSRMSLKLLRTQPHIVENRGITMAPLFLSLTS